MASIGIIANPASGKDIRRLVAHATVIDNNEKVNIVERIILAAQRFGVDRVYIMPDTFHIGLKAVDSLTSLKQLNCKVNILDEDINYSIEDTLTAAKMLEEMGVGCIISLGGDGTNRAIAKVIGDTPLLPISTGTNNVYPEMIEGTIAGITAAVVASKIYNSNMLCEKDKRIEIYKDGKIADIALIDAVVSAENFVGARAIWDISNISDIFVTRAHPCSIGFSSIAGFMTRVARGDDFGLYIRLGNSGGEVISAPISAGILEEVHIVESEKIPVDKEYIYKAKAAGTIALDGEREITIKKGENLTFKISRNGPYRVNVRKTLEVAQDSGFFTKR